MMLDALKSQDALFGVSILACNATSHARNESRDVNITTIKHFDTVSLDYIFCERSKEILIFLIYYVGLVTWNFVEVRLQS